LPLRIASWNVNSLRQRLEHLKRFVDSYAPDVLCLQETKVADGLFPAHELAEMGFPHQAFRGQKSYHGVATLARAPYEFTEYRIWWGKDDPRHQMVRLPGGLEIHNFYVPSGGPTPDPATNDKFAHKLGFLDEMAVWAAEVRDRPLLLVGDLNVAPLETDVWNHKRLVRSVGHTPGESRRIADLLEQGHLTDVGRHFVPADQPLYTWWGYRFPQAVERDYGWRLDHALATAALMPRVSGFQVARETRLWERPSDHVPVVVDLSDA